MIISFIGPSTFDQQVGILKLIAFGISNRFRFHHHLIFMEVECNTTNSTGSHPTIVTRSRPINIDDLHGIQHVARIHIPEYIYIEEYMIGLAIYFGLMNRHMNTLVLSSQ